MKRTCRHCAKGYNRRVGRGLCRACWDDKGIRLRYAPVAPFGGPEACRLRVISPRQVPIEPGDPSQAQVDYLVELGYKKLPAWWDEGGDGGN